MTRNAAAAPVGANDENIIVAVIGNPNTGKSTLFNSLTGLKQKTANYPGVTVERHTGKLLLGNQSITLVDLPGTYALSAQSPDEMISVDVLLGNIDDLPLPSAILAVADAANLRRNLFLVTQLAELGLPVVLVVNMIDLAERKGIRIDCDRLASQLGVLVVPLVATNNEGMDVVRSALDAAIKSPPVAPDFLLPNVVDAAKTICEKIPHTEKEAPGLYETVRALIDSEGAAEHRFKKVAGDVLYEKLLTTRRSLAGSSSLAAQEAIARYQRIDTVLEQVEQRSPAKPTFGERLDEITNQPVTSVVLFILVMATVFQAVFSWAAPMMSLIDSAAIGLGNMVSSVLPEGALNSLLVDGVIAGVGSVIIFLPQILILFAFIIFLEDSGYMPRVAFMADRLMRSVGLSGQSFIPMLSSFACAVPGIMATRVIPNRRDRFATMMSAPLMTCSARLPVYALLIGAFVPQKYFISGLINLQGIVLLGLYLLGIFGGVMTALLLKKTALRGPTPTFLIELPPYRLPNARSLLIKLLARAKLFLVRAGSIIFTVAVIIWATAYFPRPQALLDEYSDQRSVATASFAGDELESQLRDINRQESSALLEQSLLGRAGRFVAPAFKPLGWDWKVSAAVIAGFPAREVVVAVLGTIYAVGETDDSGQALAQRLQNAKRADGTPIYTLPMVIGMLIFYAFCLQCAATIAVMARETGGWRWPAFAWLYMTGLGYLGALLVFQLGS